MHIKFECPGCGKKFRAPGGAAGREGKCSKCGVTFHVPEDSQTEIEREPGVETMGGFPEREASETEPDVRPVVAENTCGGLATAVKSALKKAAFVLFGAAALAGLGYGAWSVFKPQTVQMPVKRPDRPDDRITPKRPEKISVVDRDTSADTVAVGKTTEKTARTDRRGPLDGLLPERTEPGKIPGAQKGAREKLDGFSILVKDAVEIEKTPVMNVPPPQGKKLVLFKLQLGANDEEKGFGGEAEDLFLESLTKDYYGLFRVLADDGRLEQTNISFKMNKEHPLAEVQLIYLVDVVVPLPQLNFRYFHPVPNKHNLPFVRMLEEETITGKKVRIKILKIRRDGHQIDFTFQLTPLKTPIDINIDSIFLGDAEGREYHEFRFNSSGSMPQSRKRGAKYKNTKIVSCDELVKTEQILNDQKRGIAEIEHIYKDVVFDENETPRGRLASRRLKGLREPVVLEYSFTGNIEVDMFGVFLDEDGVAAGSSDTTE